MFSSRLSSLRPSLRAAFRHRTPARPVGRRGLETRAHESLQERVGTGSDRPWQIAAVVVTIPGLMYLRKGIRQFHAGPPARQPQPARTEVRAEPKAEPSPQAEPTPREKFEAAIEKTRSGGSEMESSSGSEGAETPSSASSEQGESQESQGEQPAEMQASPPAEK